MRQILSKILIQTRLFVFAFLSMTILSLSAVEKPAQTVQSTVSLEVVKQALERISFLDKENAGSILAVISTIDEQLAQHADYISIDEKVAHAAYSEAMELLNKKHEIITSDDELQSLARIISVFDQAKRTKVSDAERAPRPAIDGAGSLTATTPELVDMPKDITVERDLFVGGDQTNVGDLTVGGNATINGTTTLNGPLVIVGPVVSTDLTITGNLIVEGNTTLGNADTDTIDIHGVTNINTVPAATATTTIGSATSATIVDGSFTTNGQINANGITTATGQINANGGIDNTTPAALVLGGTTATSVDIGRVGQNTAILGDASVAGTLGITGITTATGQINANGGIDNTTPAALVLGGLTATSVDIGRAGQSVSILAPTVNLPAGSTINTAAAGTITFGANVNGLRWTGPVSDNNDLANKSYVDAAAQGLRVKGAVRALAVSNIAALSGPITIDTVSLVAGDRVLLIGQTNVLPNPGSENGIWEVQAGVWTRPLDYATGSNAGASYVFVSEGLVYAATSWVVTQTIAQAPLVDTDTTTWVQFSAAVNYQMENVGAGTGLIFRDKIGQTFNLRSLLAGSNVVITTNADDITIALGATPSVTTVTASGLINADGGVDRSIAGILTLGTGANTDSINIGKAGATASTEFLGDIVLQQSSNTDPSTTGVIYTGGSKITANRFISNPLGANTFVGRGSGNLTIGTANSVAIGANAGSSITGGFGLTFVGANSGQNATTCQNVVAIGTNSCINLTTGSENTAIGHLSGNVLVDGTRNTLIGKSAAKLLISGTNNIIIGYDSAYNYTGAESNNIVIGCEGGATLGESQVIRLGISQANMYLPTGIALDTRAAGTFSIGGANITTLSLGRAGQTTAIAGSATVAGTLGITGVTTATGNVFANSNIILPKSTSTVGVVYTNGATGAANTFISNPGTANTFVGEGSGNLSVTGDNLTAIGFGSLFNITSGDSNVAVGSFAGRGITIGNRNVCVGNSTGIVLTTGDENTLIGHHAGYKLTTAVNNTLIGTFAGTKIDDTAGITTGSYNVCIGYGAGSAYNAGENNNIAIGNKAGQDNDTGVIKIGGYLEAGGEAQTSCFIMGIGGRSFGASNAAVFVDSTNKLGSGALSSLRYKTDIVPMDTQSEKILALEPVTFVYKDDATNTKRFGMIAEQVYPIYPEMVVLDDQGRPDALRLPYEFTFMMLNEIQKNHKAIAALQSRDATIAALEARIAALEGIH